MFFTIRRERALFAEANYVYASVKLKENPISFRFKLSQIKLFDKPQVLITRGKMCI